MLFWGIWMGLWIGLDQYLKNKLTRKIPGVIEGLVFILVTFTGWAVFSAPTLADGIHRLGLLFGGGGRFSQDRDLYFIQSGGMILLIALYSATGHFASLLEKSQQIPILSKIRGILTLPVQAGLLVLCLALIVTQQDTSVLL